MEDNELVAIGRVCGAGSTDVEISHCPIQHHSGYENINVKQNDFDDDVIVNW